MDDVRLQGQEFDDDEEYGGDEGGEDEATY